MNVQRSLFLAILAAVPFAFWFPGNGSGTEASIVVQVVDRIDRIRRIALHRHTDRLRAPGQHQIAIAHRLVVDPDAARRGLEAGDPGVGADFGIELLGHLAGIDTFIKITRYLAEKKVGPVVRVVGQAKVIFTQIAKLSQQISGYQAMYAKDMEEAEVILADLVDKKRQVG